MGSVCLQALALRDRVLFAWRVWRTIGENTRWERQRFSVPLVDDIGAFSYYWKVIRRAARDTRQFATARLLWASLVLVVGYAIALAAGRTSGGVPALVLYPLAALGVSTVLIFCGQLVVAPVRLARDGLAELGTAVQERDRLRQQRDDERSRTAVAARFDALRAEYLRLKDEVPPDGPVVTPEHQAVFGSIRHLGERVRSEIRMNAPPFMGYWTTNPNALPAPPPWSAYATAFIDMSIEQLSHIAARLREGHDTPNV